MDIRLCPNKPDKIGLWFYELCAPLCYGNAYLLWTTMHHSDRTNGITVPVASIVKKWASIVKKLGCNGKTLLTMDSYYLDEAGRQYLQKEDIKYIAAVVRSRFEVPFQRLTQK